MLNFRKRVLIQKESHSFQDELNYFDESALKKKTISKKVKIFYYSIFVWEVMLVGIFFLFWDTLNAFGIFYAGAASLILKSIVYLVCLILGVFRFFQLFGTNKSYLNPKIPLFLKILLSVVIVWGVIVYNWLVMSSLKGLWIANHNNKAPGLSVSNYGITTSLTRYWQADTCPIASKPWLVYITLPEEALSNIFITFHLNPESCPTDTWSPFIEVWSVTTDIKSWNKWTSYTPTKGEYRLPDHEYSSREIYTLLLKNLEELKTYAFRITHEGWSTADAQIYYYQNFNTQKMNIVNGGDIGNVKAATMINDNIVAKADADLIFVGGDIAYDNAFPEWYRWYDHLLLRLPYQVKDENSGAVKVIPLLFSTGNHDLGVNSYSEHKFKFDDTTPAFKHYFPQNTFEGGVPTLSNRKSYFTHRIGSKMLFLSLDTGYEVDIAGDQTKWLEDQLSERQYQYKFVQYHHPFYAAWSKGNVGIVADEGKKHWVPLFDKYGVTMSFENHIHGFKRTKFLKNGIPDEKGTVYLGDGSWGPLVSSCSLVNQDIIVKSGILNHVWVIKIDGNNISTVAYDENGSILDSFTMNSNKDMQ